MTIETMRKRAELIQRIRTFFVRRNYLEVDTPVMASAVIPESTIVPFETQFASPFHGQRRLYLLPSPELWMKRILAEHPVDLFQIGHCFRNSEQIGQIHNPEFTMLEWYTVGADYQASADLTDELLGALGTDESPRALRPPVRRMSMEQAFDETASIDLAACSDSGMLHEEAGRAGLACDPASSWEDLFNALFLQLVEPELPKDEPILLYDYPAQVPTLAKSIPGTPWCERWELYLGGVEVANCFTEETDPELVARFFRLEEAKLAGAGAIVRSDTSFPAIFRSPFPPCSGVALGVDRLLMSLLGIDEIEGVIFFPFSGIFD